MSAGLIITKKGKLIKSDWVYDPEIEDGEYVDTDVTKYAYRHLFDNCELGPGVTLRSIFFLLNQHVDLFDKVFGCWTKDYVNQSLSELGKPYTGKYDPDGIEWLELSWRFEQTIYKKEEYPREFHGHHFPDFGGVGFELKEDNNENWYKAGDRIPWGISFINLGDLINIPVKLRTDLEILNFDMNSQPKDIHKPTAKLEGMSYTLGHILYGILWEISWNGSPEDKIEKKKELNGAVENAMNNPENLVSLDLGDDEPIKE